jgi:hypothetical protein
MKGGDFQMKRVASDSDKLKAHYLQMSVDDYLASTEKLENQYRILKEKEKRNGGNRGQDRPVTAMPTV